MSKRYLIMICPGCSYVDILRNLWNTRNKMSTHIKYHHVDGHMDKYLHWYQLAMEHTHKVQQTGKEGIKQDNSDRHE